MAATTSSTQAGWKVPRPFPGRGKSGSRASAAMAGWSASSEPATSDIAKVVVGKEALATASAASALSRSRRVGASRPAPSAVKKSIRSTPARSAASTSRQVAIEPSSSIVARGWSCAAAPRWITVRTPRTALRRARWSVSSPRAICTLTRSAPSRRGSLTMQRTGRPASVSRGSSAEPMKPVAPVTSSIA